MSLFGDVLKKMTAAAAVLGETVVDGLGDLAESVTGENAIAKAARAAGTTVVRGAKEVADATINVGEAIVETIFGDDGEQASEGNTYRRAEGAARAPDFVEPAEG